MVVSPWSSTVDPTSTTPALRKLQGHHDHDSDAPPLDINVFSSGALFVVAVLVVAYFGQVRTRTKKSLASCYTKAVNFCNKSFVEWQNACSCL